MKFDTHKRVPNKSRNKLIDLTFGSLCVLWIALACLCSFYIESIAPAILILAPMVLLLIIQSDMSKAYIEINENSALVVDYYFGGRKEKTILLQEISFAEILLGSSLRVRGYRYSSIGCSYIVLRNSKKKYLFKVICTPETRQFFDKYLN